MSVDLQRLVDLDDRYLDQVPFGRNRFLRIAGIALFGLAAQMVASKTVYATHQGPSPCYGFNLCDCCSGASCCLPGCCRVRTDQYHQHCSSQTQCWYVCSSGTMYQCCDYHYNCGSTPCSQCGYDDGWPYHCICKGNVGTC